MSEDAKPDKIVAFDKARKKLLDIDLDKPFFTVKQHVDHPACNHRDRGVTLDIPTRTVFCRCGEEIDAFDGLLIYAHSERRLQSTRHVIEEHARKEQEKKDKQPHSKRVTGATRIQTKRGRHLGWQLQLECGHPARWEKKKLPRTATCDRCYRAAMLTANGVGVAKA